MVIVPHAALLLFTLLSVLIKSVAAEVASGFSPSSIATVEIYVYGNFLRELQTVCGKF